MLKNEKCLYEPWKFADKSTCIHCHRPIYYSASDTVWLHYDHQYFCDGKYGVVSKQSAEPISGRDN